jgi:lysophospholipase
VDSNSETLLLADGAMAQENLPLFPLLQPSRKVDVILAFDAVEYNFDVTPLLMIRWKQAIGTLMFS